MTAAKFPGRLLDQHLYLEELSYTQTENELSTIFSREVDLQFSWIRIECKLFNNPASNKTIVLAQVALDGLFQSTTVQAFIVNQTTVVSGRDTEIGISINTSIASVHPMYTHHII